MGMFWCSIIAYHCQNQKLGIKILKIFGKLAVRTMAFLMFMTICVCCSPSEEVLHDEFRKSGKLEVWTFDELRSYTAFQPLLEGRFSSSQWK